MRESLERIFGFVTDHNLVVIVLMLVLSAGVVSGTSQLQLESEANGSEAIGDTDVAQKLSYIQDNYGRHNESNETTTEPAAVYVRDADGNALSKAALLDSLRFQQTVRENESVAAALGDREVVGVANLVATRAAGDPDATLAEQIAALESVSESEVERLVGATLTEGSPALRLLPESYEPGTTTAESHRMVFQFADTEERSAATAALYETADAREDPAYFTTGEHASAAITRQAQRNTVELILPVALAMIFAVLAFSYRDVVDVLVGFTGVVLSVLWMFGILGWLQIPAGMTLIIGPVLVVGLSVDYGLHVFVRYREQRGEDEAIRPPMTRGLSAVSVALGLVTLTAMVGFLANATNEFVAIRQLAVGITLGVFSTFVVSVTVVPALKVTVDGLLERVGFDRRKRPLGKTRLLRPLLSTGPRLAARAAPAVIVVALVAGSAGAVAWTDLDRQSFQQAEDGVAEWKQDLPGPLAWEVAEESRESQYVRENYRAAEESHRRRSNLLFEGDVTDPGALVAVQAAHVAADDQDAVYTQGGSAPVTSPLTVMQAVAAEDREFAQVYREADTDGDGVPDRDVEAVYDALYAADPEAASQVVERTDGEYRSLRMVVPVDASATYPAQADGMEAVEAAADAESDAVSVVAVGAGTLSDAEAAQTADNILRTLVVALAAVTVLLVVVYRIVVGSASLGAVTALPIALVTALVVGGMWLLDVPLTLLTALLLSLVVGIGIDYNIHVSDRFAQELERGRSVQGGLVEATTGTGGALLGSTLTSVGAFSALLLHVHPQIRSFGTLVVLALSLSFVVAVFVLPSLLRVWAGTVRESADESVPAPAEPSPQDD